MNKNNILKDSSLNIINFLYKTYYSESHTYSTVTSSHWRKYGKFQKVNKIDNIFSMSGSGFGEFRHKKLLSILIGIPTQIFLLKMLFGCNEKTLEAAKKISKFTNRIFTYDLARMGLSLDFINKYTDYSYPKNIVIIGDGYGSLGTLYKEIYPKARITYINLGRTLIFDAYYSGCAFPYLSHKLISSNSDTLCKDFNYVEAESVNKFKIEGDLFINIASMQEMNIEVITDYFKMMREQNKDTLFYCCNRIEKILPDGIVTKFIEYGWKEDDEIIVDEICPWHQRAPKGRPPFVYKFDGPTQHRLVKVKQFRNT
jgi:hypothetical protein